MLSVVITAWNEEKHLARAVRSVKSLADEVLVIDTESTDGTAALAKKLGCRVISHPRPGIVEKVRNFSISKAVGPWVLLLDADEEVSPGLAREIKKVIASDSCDYCRIPRKNIIFGKWIRSDHWWPDMVYRLFKKRSIVWQETIHSIPITKGRGFDFPLSQEASLVHYNYATVGDYLDRLNRYTDFQCRDLLTDGYRFQWTDLLTKPIEEFLIQYYARGGFRDGIHGLSLALLQAFSQAVLYLKIWQADGFPQQPVEPTEVNLVFSGKSKEYSWWYFRSRIDDSAFPMNWYWRLVRKMKSL